MAAWAEQMVAASAEHIQEILAAEVSPAKARAILASGMLASQSSLVSDAERARIGRIPPDALQNALGNGVRCLTEESYPELLLETNVVGPGLFVSGDPSCLHRPTVGIVGTRNASAYGKACAQKFAEVLALRGVTIVSGGALGIDAAAHRGAIAVQGSTTVVLANGVDVTYPAAHTELFKQVRANGAIVSQYACGTKPSDYKFLQRNALIAALSQAVLVIEAPLRSGALRTAHVANDLGRPVMVVPSSIEHQNFWGSFGLIRDGATLVHHPDQVLEFLDLEPVLSGLENESGTVATSYLSDRILSALTVDPMPIEKIAEHTAASTSDILAELTMLELDGRIIRSGPGYAIRP
jgi:DNA processing protein